MNSIKLFSKDKVMLNDREVIVLLMICSFTMRGMKFFVTQEHIGDDLKCSRGYLNKVMGRLRSLGVVQSQKLSSDNKSDRRLSYTIVKDSVIDDRGAVGIESFRDREGIDDAYCVDNLKDLRRKNKVKSQDITDRVEVRVVSEKTEDRATQNSDIVALREMVEKLLIKVSSLEGIVSALTNGAPISPVHTPQPAKVAQVISKTAANSNSATFSQEEVKRMIASTYQTSSGKKKLSISGKVDYEKIFDLLSDERIHTPIGWLKTQIKKILEDGDGKISPNGLLEKLEYARLPENFEGFDEETHQSLVATLKPIVTPEVKIETQQPIREVGTQVIQGVKPDIVETLVDVREKPLTRDERLEIKLEEAKNGKSQFNDYPRDTIKRDFVMTAEFVRAYIRYILIGTSVKTKDRKEVIVNSIITTGGVKEIEYCKKIADIIRSEGLDKKIINSVIEGVKTSSAGQYYWDSIHSAFDNY